MDPDSATQPTSPLGAASHCVTGLPVDLASIVQLAEGPDVFEY